MSLTSGEETKTNLMVFKSLFDREIIMCFILALCVGVWYVAKKHWVANNIFGLAFAVNGIEFLQLNQVLNGCILLGGLFFYDIFWVFGTDVMVSVAKSFDAPIKRNFYLINMNTSKSNDVTTLFFFDLLSDLSTRHS